VYRVRVQIPPPHESGDFSSFADKERLLKGGQVISTPIRGKARTYTYSGYTESMGGVNRRIVIDAPVYGERRITFEAPDPKDAWLIPNALYGKSLWEGYSVSCSKDQEDPGSGPLQFEIKIQ